MLPSPDFVRRELIYGCWFLQGNLPGRLMPGLQEFERLWRLHPARPPEILIHGRRVLTPRWQEIYGADYHFTGSRHVARPVPPDFEPWLEWAREMIEPRLNGIVVNWYDAALGHYIGRHRDSTKNMVRGTPIVMISLGQTRMFVLRRWKGEEKVELPVVSGAVVVIPYETNLRWTHEVKRPSRGATGNSESGRADARFRISITLRAFHGSEASLP